jgi:putative nucleotidyltransferase with HDIG domain
LSDPLHLSRAPKLYVIAAVAVSVGLVAFGWAVRPLSLGQLPTVLYLAVGTQVAALLPIRWRNGVQTVSDPLLIATGLLAPGAGVGLVAWLATFDGRVPGRTTTWWAFVFNRAMYATAHVLGSLATTMIVPGEPWGLPVQTAFYVAASVSINYLMAARYVSLVSATSFWQTLAQNVGGLSTLTSTAILGFSGGILALLIAKTPDHIGYLMAPGLFGFVLAVRGNVAAAQRQTQVKDQTLELAAQFLDARDRYTESHSIRVAELAGQLGEHLDLGDRECELLRTAGSLHDLGKVGVRDEILNKPGPLTDDEWEIMRRHPDIGADMIAQHSALEEVAPLVRHHHERWDGTGYPAGLKGDVIPFGARILSVADSFDTITGARLYRRSLMTPIEGVEDISRRAGRWYDPNVVDALRALHGLEPLEVVDRPMVPRRITTMRVLSASPSFSRLLIAIGISALGDPLTQVAALVSLYAANHDPRLVALGFIAQSLGTVLLSGALGGVADRFRRRPLLVTLESLRAIVLLITPVLALFSIWSLVGVLFVLSAINAIVQPARQAAIPAIVSVGQVGKANAIVAATTTTCGAVGYGIAGLFLASAAHIGPLSPTAALFVADAITFAAAAALISGIVGLGGGTVQTRLTGSIRRAWANRAARSHLTVAVLAAFLIAISYPALLAFAYQLNPTGGAQTYSTLELIISLGVVMGSIVVGRSDAIGSMRTAGVGLLLTGLFSLAMTLSPTFALVAFALLVASIGNPIYTVANQTALVEAADPDHRGTIMATRFVLVQVGIIAGTAVGGLITKAATPLAAYGVLAIGLILVGMFAIAAGRRTTSPLHGVAYEEATLMAAGAQSQAK